MTPLELHQRWLLLEACLLQIRAGLNEARAGSDKALALLKKLEEKDRASMSQLSLEIERASNDPA